MKLRYIPGIEEFSFQEFSDVNNKYVNKYSNSRTLIIVPLTDKRRYKSGNILPCLAFKWKLKNRLSSSFEISELTKNQKKPLARFAQSSLIIITYLPPPGLTQAFTFPPGGAGMRTGVWPADYEKARSTDPASDRSSASYLNTFQVHPSN